MQEWGRWDGTFFRANFSADLKEVPHPGWFLCPSFPRPYMGLCHLKHTNEFSCLLFILDVIWCLEATLAWEEGWELSRFSKGSHANTLSLLQQWRGDKQVISGGKGEPIKEWDFLLLPRKKLPFFGTGLGYFHTSHSILFSHQEPDMVTG